MFSFWKHLRRTKIHPAPRQKSPQRPRYVKPQLQCLEKRELLSAFLFTDAMGGGGWNTAGNWGIAQPAGKPTAVKFTLQDVYTAKPSEFRKATQRVYRTRALPSHVSLRLLP